MAGKARAVTAVVKLGMKYGPVAYEAIKHGREPAKEFAVKQFSKLTARKQALTHAEGLTDGSAMPVFDGDLQVWVVFNGDEAIASHPTVTTPLAQLIQGYDLTRRIRPTSDQRHKATPIPKATPIKGIRGRR